MSHLLAAWPDAACVYKRSNTVAVATIPFILLTPKCAHILPNLSIDTLQLRPRLRRPRRRRELRQSLFQTPTLATHKCTLQCGQQPAAEAEAEATEAAWRAEVIVRNFLAAGGKSDPLVSEVGRCMHSLPPCMRVCSNCAWSESAIAVPGVTNDSRSYLM